jgi:hypothetical protein
VNGSRCLFLLATVLVLSQESGYLDLTTQTLLLRLNEPTSVSGVVAGTGAGDRAASHDAPQPLDLTISSVEGADHSVGGILVYEVKILNSSKEVVRIPTTISPREIEPPKPGPYQYWMASLTPRIIDSSGQIEVLEEALLYGADGGSTMLELPSGHWVRIRAKTRLRVPEPSRILVPTSR